jgi:hypothetical protein
LALGRGVAALGVWPKARAKAVLQNRYTLWQLWSPTQAMMHSGM